MDPEASTTCFVGNLSWNSNEDTIREHFSECGTVVSVRIGAQHGHMFYCPTLRFQGHN